MSFITFRKIGARNKTQGGSSYNNLAVTNVFNLLGCTMIEADQRLVDSTAKALFGNTTLIQNLAVQVRRYVEYETMLGRTALFASYIYQNIALFLVQDTTFLSNILSTLNLNFLPFAIPNITQDTNFISQVLTLISTAVVPFTLVSPNIVKTIGDLICEYLPVNQPFLGVYGNNIANQFTSTYYNELIAKLETIQNLSYGSTFVVPSYILYNTITLNLFKLIITKKTSYTFRIVCSLQTADGFLTRVVFKTVNTETNLLDKILLDTTYSPSVGNASIDIEQVLNNTTDSDRTVYLSMYCETTAGYVLVFDGFVTTDVSTITTVTNLPVSFQHPLPLESSTTAINIYNSSSAVVKTIAIPDATYNGLVQYSLGNVVWSRNIRYTLGSYLVPCVDYSTYMVCTVNDRVTVTTPAPVTNNYNGGEPIMLIKFKTNGDVDWFANISSIGLTNETLNGVSTDASNSAYVYGSHPTGDKLFAYNKDFVIYPVFIDATSTTDASGLLNKANAFIIKYNNDGYIAGFATIKGYEDQTIFHVLVDSTNVIYAAASSSSSDTTTVYGFNNTTFVLPTKARGFVLRLNNVSSTSTQETAAIVVPTNYVQATDTYIFDPTATVRAIDVFVNMFGSIFALYSSNADFVELYNFDNYIEPVVTEVEGKIILVKYNSNLIFWYYTFTSVFLVDENPHICLNVNGDIYMTCRSTSSLIATNYTVPQTYDLPITENDVSFVVKLLDVDQNIDPASFIKQYATIANSSIRNVRILADIIYIEFDFTNVSTVCKYNIDTDTLDEIFNIGINTKNGRGVIRLDVNLNPSLVGFYVKT